MADASTTNLDDLPLSPQNDGNIQLETKEMNVKIDNPAQELQTTRETDPKLSKRI